MTGIQYDKLTDTEAMNILREEDENNEINNVKNKIIKPKEVLYWKDAYGSLKDAIKLQGFDKELPSRAIKGLLDSNIDLHEAVETHNLESQECPMCTATLWEFKVQQGSGYTARVSLDEHGNVETKHMEFVSNSDGYYYNANQNEGHSPYLCGVCSRDTGYNFPTTLNGTNSVVAHIDGYERTMFSVVGNIARLDYMWRHDTDDVTDLYRLPGEELDLIEAFAQNKNKFFEKHDWTVISNLQNDEQKPKRHFRNEVKEMMKAERANPDLQFTYILDNHARWPCVWVAQENKEEMKEYLRERVENAAAYP